VTAKPPGVDDRKSLWAALLGLGIGVLTVVIATGVISIVDRRPLNLADEAPMFLLQIILVALPFLFMAFLGIVGRVPWLVGIGLTAALWGYALYDALSGGSDGGRMNYGLSLLLLASPILITFACLIPGRRELRGGGGQARNS
jgi:hypothetical protein